MTVVFPDNTALLNFAYINRIDLLAYLINGAGVWCSAVARESATWRLEPGFEAVGEVGSIFGDPLFPTQAELIDVTVLRDRLAGPGDGRRQHLGEAETIVIARNRFPEARFVTDDADAQRAARSDGLRPLGTGNLLDLAVRVGQIDSRTSAGYEAALRQASRIPARWRH